MDIICNLTWLQKYLYYFIEWCSLDNLNLKMLYLLSVIPTAIDKNWPCIILSCFL